MDRDMKMGKANLEIFSETLQEMAETNRDLLVVTSDSRGSGKLVPFAQRFPNQLVEVGIAEQNLVGISAGLASTGKQVFAVSPACFLTARSLEQIKNDVTYSDNPVTVVGISAGVSYGALGSTHHSLHDYAVLRAIHNIVVCAPADNFETQEAVRQSAAADHPVYLRFGKRPMPLLREDIPFVFGKGRVLQEGEDIAIFATGETVHPALDAAALLSESLDVKAMVISMHTVKPLDTELLAKVAAAGTPILTVEEHSVNGGMGEACASFLLQHGFHSRFRIMGIPDEYTVTGSQQEILDHYGINGQGIAENAKQLLGISGENK
ncbi:transketolase family protein [Sphingobacterium chuzhouense]|uniref:Transketolase family protein n=1 Tax=Sphingobacterium chuzhouense TaxID=1742264 RepID=A0ABR7XMY9_9SPHI|nr:transketolase C-terminal domain-containing protein [Sphingobacterium chuzhouense]MBD1420540.1 transketolase family protein [Sphingobacterium chuzhouense]